MRRFPDLLMLIIFAWLVVHEDVSALNSIKRRKRQVDLETCESGCPSDTSQPVCGTDGVTYDNFCKLRCSSRTVPGLGGKCRGKCPCEKPSPLMSMICEVKDKCPPQIPRGQMCGTDERTYTDACDFLCSQHSAPDLGVQCGGACPCPKAESPCSKCSEEYRPICGTNAITYGNQCMFACARMNNPNLFPSCRTECPCADNSTKTIFGAQDFLEHLKSVFLIPL